MGRELGASDSSRDKYNVGRRLTAIEAALRQLKTSMATVGRAGVAGTTTYYDETNTRIAVLGSLGDLYTGLRTYQRNGGRILFESVSRGLSGRTTIYEGAGNQILSDDPFVGGMARPRVPLGQWVDYAALGTAAAPTTSATYVTLQALFAYQQAPSVRMDFLVSSSSSGTTGNVRVVDPSGNQVGSAIAVPANAVTSVTLGPIALPAWPGSQGLAGYFTLQAQRTAGTGTIGARGFGAWGVASYDTA